MQQQLTDIDEKQYKRIQRCLDQPYILKLTNLYRSDVFSKCNYCQKKDGWLSWSFNNIGHIDSYLYQLMVLRGWYRCGNYHLKVNLKKTCCLVLTHRLNATKFSPNKDQIKALASATKIQYHQKQPIIKCLQQSPQKTKQNLELKKLEQKKQIKQDDYNRFMVVCDQLMVIIKKQLPAVMDKLGFSKQLIETVQYQIRKNILFFVSKDGDSHDFYSNFIMLFLGKNKKIFSTIKQNQKQLFQTLKLIFKTYSSEIQIQIDIGKGGYLLFKNHKQINKQQKTTLDQITLLKKESEMQSEQQNLQIKQQLFMKNQQPTKKQKKKHHLSKMISEEKSHNKIAELNISKQIIHFGKITIKITPAIYEDESYQIYKKYQRNIHQQQSGPTGYESFLCVQSIKFRQQYSQLKGLYCPTWNLNNKWQTPYEVGQNTTKMVGCYHMKYYYQSQLIAVGVVDILDHGMVSNYFFYDTDFKKYRLGVLSALIEIEYIRYLNIKFPQFKYYFIGSYVANNQKVKYKVNYMPCQLQCPVTYEFIEYSDNLRNKIQKIISEDTEKRLSQNNVKVITDMFLEEDLSQFINSQVSIIDNHGTLKKFNQLNKYHQDRMIRILKAYVPAFGKQISSLIQFKTAVLLQPLDVQDYFKTD